MISSDSPVFVNLRPNAAKFGLGIGAFIVWPLTLGRLNGGSLLFDSGIGRTLVVQKRIAWRHSNESEC